MNLVSDIIWREFFRYPFDEVYVILNINGQ